MPKLTIQELLDGVGEKLKLNLRAGKGGLERIIRVPRIQKPGLALTGYDQQLDVDRLLTWGGTEINFLKSATEAQRLRDSENFFYLIKPCASASLRPFSYSHSMVPGGLPVTS